MLVVPVLVRITGRSAVRLTSILPNWRTAGLHLNLDEAGARADGPLFSWAAAVQANTSTKTMPDKSEILGEGSNGMRRSLERLRRQIRSERCRRKLKGLQTFFSASRPYLCALPK